MFTPSGQPDHRMLAVFGGGKGGGGGGSQPTYAPVVLTDPVNGKTFVQNTDPMSQLFGAAPGMSAQEQLNAEIADRQSQEKAKSDADAQTAADTLAQTKADAATTAANAESTFQTKKTQSYNDAMNSVIRAFQLQGADPNQYMDSDITPALQKQLNSINDLDPNPSSAFASNLGDTIVNSVTSGKRTGALNALNNIFTPTYANTALPDSLTGQYSTDLVNEQFDPLQTQLDNAQKRNTLSGAGYNAAEAALNQKKAAALTTVNNLGAGIVGTDRSGLNDYISGARSDANALTLAGTFDPNSYKTQADTMVGTDTSNFGGALRNAIGDTKFASIQDLINAGGVGQGGQNPTAANPGGTPTTADGGGPLSPNYISDEELAKQQRGLGNTGAF